jgi:transcriptional regulator with XRE-family HTH domain
MASELDITPAQVRAARALLGWSQQELARHAQIGSSTVADFEREKRVPVPQNLAAMAAALEKAGIQFGPAGAVAGGPPTPAAPAPMQRGTTPKRWIDATDLKIWADRREAQAVMPEVLRRLIRAALGQAATLRFPSGDSVQMPGWDGTCEVERGTDYIPSGSSCWEIGIQREKIRKKADDDYKKRTTGFFGQASATFVFVTPRRWRDKGKWAKQKAAEGKWADVKAYDADDIEAWIELYPGVGQWLAVKMGKRPPGLRQLEEAWEEWSLSAKWPLTTDLILAGRDEEATGVLKWLRGPGAVLSVQADTTDEAIAFLYAAIAELPPDHRLQYYARCLIATTADQARALGDSPSRLILVLDGADDGLANRLVQQGHHVYVAHGSDLGTPGDVLRLSRPPLHAMESALKDMHVQEKLAQKLARDSARSLSVLRRLIPSASGQAPEWSKQTNARALIPALLAGGWNEDLDGDRAILERLSGRQWPQIAEELIPWITASDSPVRKAGTTWKIASPRDAWFLLARYLTTADIERFAAATLDVLGAADPRFEMKADERWYASVKGVRGQYSDLLRVGLGETLILLALFGDRAPGITRPDERAEAIVGKLLRDANADLWWSLSGDFRVLAEAAPQAFMSAIDSSLNQSEPPIMALFQRDGGLVGGEYLSGLLWALEALAWDRRYLGRAAKLLARLAAVDPPGSNWANRPKNSLRHIFLLWMPQTNATLDERLQVLDGIRQGETSQVAWRLMIGMLPTGHDVGHFSSSPRWRDFAPPSEEVTYALIARGAEELTKRLLEDVGLSTGRWKDLIQALPNLAPQTREQAIAQLRHAAGQINDAAQKRELWSVLRAFLHHHRSCPEAQWALPAADLDRIDEVYDLLEPTELIERFAWLFNSSEAGNLPRPSGGDYRADDRMGEQLRRLGVDEILAKHGVDGIFRLAGAQGVDRAVFVGITVAVSECSASVKDEILVRALKSEGRPDIDVADGMIGELFRSKGQAWIEKLVQRARAEAWGSEAVYRILRGVPPKTWVWDLAASCGKTIEDLYWKRVGTLWIDGTDAEIAVAMKKLLGIGRATHAVRLASQFGIRGLDSSLLVRALSTAAAEEWPNEGNEASMFVHAVEDLLKHLDQAADVNEEDIARLEFAYLPLLTRFSRRPPRVLHKTLATNSEFFVMVLRNAFKPSDESGIKEEAPADPDRQANLALLSYELLRSWRHVPGTGPTGLLDGAALKDWIARARELSVQCGRAVIADQEIGQVLAHAKPDPNGLWPNATVRDVIESVQSDELERGVAVGVYNKRGATWRGPHDGGQQEKALAEAYRMWASRIALKWPRTAALLEGIAKTYDREGQWHDEDAERDQW